ncbi:cyclic nucleotide-binding domain-containing protein [Elusimicrobiota bacterium]
MAGEPTKKDIEVEHLRWLAKALDIYVIQERLKPEELIGKLSSLTLLEYPEGTEVVREGEPGRDLFILYQGSATVSRDEKEIATMASGDLFGEIGFLVGVPRTATVTARAGCEAFRCEAKAFEELLCQHPNLVESMRTIAKLRMERLHGPT